MGRCGGVVGSYDGLYKWGALMVYSGELWWSGIGRVGGLVGRYGGQVERCGVYIVGSFDGLKYSGEMWLSGIGRCGGLVGRYGGLVERCWVYSGGCR